MELISFRDFLELEESKNVGTLYHFTRLSSLKGIIDSEFCLGSHQPYISFTRNYDMINYNHYKNDSNGLGLGPSSFIVRIAIDGDILSNEYKIEPFIDIKNNIKRNQGEWEERVIKPGIKKKHKDRVCIKKALRQIDILDIVDFDINQVLSDIKIKYNIVKKFKPVKGK